MDPTQWDGSATFGEQAIHKICDMYPGILDPHAFNRKEALSEWGIFRAHARGCMMSLPLTGLWEMYFRSYAPKMQHFTRVVVLLMGVSPSSIPCETLFSHVKLIWSNLRSTTDPLTIQRLSRCWAHGKAGHWDESKTTEKVFIPKITERSGRRPGTSGLPRKKRSDTKIRHVAVDELEAAASPEMPVTPNNDDPTSAQQATKVARPMFWPLLGILVIFPLKKGTFLVLKKN